MDPSHILGQLFFILQIISEIWLKTATFFFYNHCIFENNLKRTALCNIYKYHSLYNILYAMYIIYCCICVCVYIQISTHLYIMHLN